MDPNDLTFNIGSTCATDVRHTAVTCQICHRMCLLHLDPQFVQGIWRMLPRSTWKKQEAKTSKLEDMVGIFIHSAPLC